MEKPSGFPRRDMTGHLTGFLFGIHFGLSIRFYDCTFCGGIVSRRPKQRDTEQLRQDVIRQLEAVQAKLQSGTLRERVQALVPAFLAMRDLGAVQMSTEKGGREAARARILRYFRDHAGQVIAGHELMVVSGIGEYPRRVRELRVEHGWPIISGMTVKEMQEDTDEDQGDDLPQMKPDEYMLI